MPTTLVAFCIEQMMRICTHATDAQAAKASDNEQQQEAKLHKELLEQHGKDKVDDDEDSELVFNIDSCNSCAWSQLQYFCVLTACICLRMYLFLFS